MLARVFQVVNSQEPSRVLDLSYRLALLAGGKSHIVKKTFLHGRQDPREVAV